MKIDGVQAVSLDRQGNIYIADEKGSIKKYNRNGKLQNEFSPQRKGSISLLDAWNPLRIFIFYDDFQEYLFLDRFLTNSNRYELASVSAFIGAVAPSSDNNLWLVDNVEFSLKKLNLNYNQIVIQTNFDLLLDIKNYEITFIREYQNSVFVCDKLSGILIFDNLGNYLRTIKAREVDYFQFLEDELYYLKNDVVHFINIYNGKKRQIQLQYPGKYVLIESDKLFLVQEKALKIFKKTP